MKEHSRECKTAAVLFPFLLVLCTGCIGGYINLFFTVYKWRSKKDHKPETKVSRLMALKIPFFWPLLKFHIFCPLFLECIQSTLEAAMEKKTHQILHALKNNFQNSVQGRVSIKTSKVLSTFPLMLFELCWHNTRLSVREKLLIQIPLVKRATANIYNFHRKIERRKVITLAKKEGIVLGVKKTELLHVRCWIYTFKWMLRGLVISPHWRLQLVSQYEADFSALEKTHHKHF